MQVEIALKTKHIHNSSRCCKCKELIEPKEVYLVITPSNKACLNCGRKHLKAIKEEAQLLLEELFEKQSIKNQKDDNG